MSLLSYFSSPAPINLLKPRDVGSSNIKEGRRPKAQTFFKTFRGQGSAPAPSDAAQSAKQSAPHTAEANPGPCGSISSVNTAGRENPCCTNNVQGLLFGGLALKLGTCSAALGLDDSPQALDQWKMMALASKEQVWRKCQDQIAKVDSGFITDKVQVTTWVCPTFSNRFCKLWA